MKNEQSDFRKATEKGLNDAQNGRTISVMKAREHLKLKQIPDSWDDLFDCKDRVTPDFISYRFPSKS